MNLTWNFEKGQILIIILAEIYLNLKFLEKQSRFSYYRIPLDVVHIKQSANDQLNRLCWILQFCQCSWQNALAQTFAVFQLFPTNACTFRKIIQVFRFYVRVAKPVVFGYCYRYPQWAQTHPIDIVWISFSGYMIYLRYPLITCDDLYYLYMIYLNVQWVSLRGYS